MQERAFTCRTRACALLLHLHILSIFSSFLRYKILSTFGWFSQNAMESCIPIHLASFHFYILIPAKRKLFHHSGIRRRKIWWILKSVTVSLKMHSGLVKVTSCCPFITQWSSPLTLNFVLLFFFLLFRATLVTYGSSQRSEPHLWLTPQLTATPDPRPTERAQGSNPHLHGY